MRENVGPGDARGEVGGVGNRRHLVAEVSAGHDGPGGEPGGEASPTPSRARPAVPMVPKEVPVMSEKTAQMSTVLTRNMEGERSFRPQ